MGKNQKINKCTLINTWTDAWKKNCQLLRNQMCMKLNNHEVTSKILNFTLLTFEMSAIVQYFEYSLALPFFGIGMKTDLFQSCGHCWVFQICWHVECSTYIASSFRIWKSSTGIPSPPLVLLIVMLPKVHSTLHSRMSGSRWVITLSWLSGSWRSFCTILYILATSS